MFSSPLRPTSGPTGHRSRSLVSITDHLSDIQEADIVTDVAAFVFLIVFILRLKADRGQSRMTRLMRTILQGGIHYFFVMAGFHIAMLFLSIFGRVIALLPFVERGILTPYRPSLPSSLRL